jgi:hypothetical protein
MSRGFKIFLICMTSGAFAFANIFMILGFVGGVLNVSFGGTLSETQVPHWVFYSSTLLLFLSIVYGVLSIKALGWNTARINFICLLVIGVVTFGLNFNLDQIKKDYYQENRREMNCELYWQNCTDEEIVEHKKKYGDLYIGPASSSQVGQIQ